MGQALYRFGSDWRCIEIQPLKLLYCYHPSDRVAFRLLLHRGQISWHG